MNILRTKSAGGYVLNKHNELLMVQEFGKFWGLPKGHLEDNELPLTAAKREIYEEAGIKNLTIIKLLGVYERSTYDEYGIPNHKEMKNITMYLFTTNQITLSPKDPDITDAKWMNFEKARKLLLNVSELEFFDQAIEKIKRQH